MCYSAQVWADYRRYVREWGADISIKEFFDLFFRRAGGERVIIPRAMEASFEDSTGPDGERIRALIEQHRNQQRQQLRDDLEKQRVRLAAAEAALTVKITKTATDSKRIAGSKIVAIQRRLDQLDNPELLPSDSRIFPGSYALVMVSIDGHRQVLPMRYQCRPAGKPASYDTRFPGTYNARRDNLDGFWREQFGHTHGVLVANAFYENVLLHHAEGRDLRPGEDPRMVVVEFMSEPPQELLLACLWSRWTAPGEPDLLSFALITNEPPPEVAAAGHDRCVIALRPENLDKWLNPEEQDTGSLLALLDDRPPHLHYVLSRAT